MKISISFAIAPVLFMYMHCAQAWEEPFARMACIPESRYFRIDHLAVYGNAVFPVGADEKRLRKIYQAWARHGLHQTTNLKYKCTLSQTRYAVHIVRGETRQSGHCAAAPRATITLLRNGLPVLDRVPFGDDCYGAPSFSSIEIRDNGENSGEMTLCLSRYYSAPLCKELDSVYAKIGNRIWTGEVVTHPPIDEEKVEELAKELGLDK